VLAAVVKLPSRIDRLTLFELLQVPVLGRECANGDGSGHRSILGRDAYGDIKGGRRCAAPGDGKKRKEKVNTDR
jgi:hypothetical protein